MCGRERKHYIELERKQIYVVWVRKETCIMWQRKEVLDVLYIVLKRKETCCVGKKGNMHYVVEKGSITLCWKEKKLVVWVRKEMFGKKG